MTDIVERLRDHALLNKQERCKLFEEAAAEIERLRNVAQPAPEPPFLESLRKTAKVMKKAHDAGGNRWMSIWQEDLHAVEEAIAALSGGE